MRNRKMKFAGICALALTTVTVAAGEVTVEEARLVRQVDGWRFIVTVSHEDTGWSHFADRWRVVTPSGQVLGERILHHPHIKEQPFTRSKTGINIPPQENVVVVEAHDSVHGWSPHKLYIDMRFDEGENYTIERR